MEIANAMLKIARNGSNIPVIGITPAEAVIMEKLHGTRAGSNALSDITITGLALALREGEFGVEEVKDVLRTDAQEAERLRGRFAVDHETKKPPFEMYYPGVSPKLPQTFAEAGIPATRAETPKINSGTPVGANTLSAPPSSDDEVSDDTFVPTSGLLS